MKPHEWIDVGDRRWCVGCDLFQSRKAGREWAKSGLCPRYTPYAVRVDNEPQHTAIHQQLPKQGNRS